MFPRRPGNSSTPENSETCRSPARCRSAAANDDPDGDTRFCGCQSVTQDLLPEIFRDFRFREHCNLPTCLNMICDSELVNEREVQNIYVNKTLAASSWFC